MAYVNKVLEVKPQRYETGMRAGLGSCLVFIASHLVCHSWPRDVWNKWNGDTFLTVLLFDSNIFKRPTVSALVPGIRWPVRTNASQLHSSWMLVESFYPVYRGLFRLYMIFLFVVIFWVLLKLSTPWVEVLSQVAPVFWTRPWPTANLTQHGPWAMELWVDPLGLLA